MALKRLTSEYKQLVSEPNSLFSVSPNEKNFLLWDVLLFGPPDTWFEGGIFKGQLTFPKDYPNKPPVFKFITEIPHPNFYKDGRVCISILHEGKDEYGYEDIAERWMPSHSVTTILLSISVLFSEPNFESPADIDASIQWKNDTNNYKNNIYKLVASTQK
jgi:ubiquitin-conjugating enzyme E2 G1